MTTEEWVLDPWTPASHKKLVGDRALNGVGVMPTWTIGHERRLGAYRTYDAFTRNAARHLRPVSKSEDADEFREYGDAALIVRQVLAALLGDDYTITVDGAINFDPDLGNTDPLVDTDPVTGQPVKRPAPDVSTEAKAENEQAARALDRQDWLQSWADDESWATKVYENERNAVKLGDGVYVLGWSPKKGRARLKVYDPGFYFPVLDDGDDEDFPRRVHIAWEVEQEPQTKRLIPPGTESQSTTATTVVRRITWELVEGEAYTLPWNDAPTTTHCRMTDATFETRTDRRGVDDFSLANATFRTNEEGLEIRDLDIGIDFIPVIHIPNTIAGAQHYGESSLATILQILDDLIAADTDLAAAARLVGIPPLALSGVTSGSTEVETYGPGQLFKLGPDGGLDVVDTSGSLVALAAYIDTLLARLAVNARIPESVLGRVKPSEVPSGVALSLSFGPLQTMISEMRLVRREKYALLLRFVQRFALLFGELPAGAEIMDANVVFGSFLPSDRKAVVDYCVAAVQAKIMSRLTAVRLMMAAGVDIEDAQAEVDRIQAEDFAGAQALFDAVGDEAEARRYLGLEGAGPLPPPPPPPALDPNTGLPVNNPPAPPQPTPPTPPTPPGAP